MAEDETDLRVLRGGRGMSTVVNAELARLVRRYKQDHFCTWSEAVERAAPALLRRELALQMAVAQAAIADRAIQFTIEQMDDGDDYA